MPGVAHDAGSFSKKDIDALRNFYPISRDALQRRFQKTVSNFRPTRSFYEGYGPSWPIIINKSFARLKQFDLISSKFAEFARNSGRMFIILGEAGAGKSTCTMSTLLDFSDASRQSPIFEYKESSGTIREAFLALRKFLNGEDCFVLVEDLHVYADEISDIASNDQFSFVKFISSARLSDWNSRIALQFPRNVMEVVLNRFTDADVDEIISKVLEYVPVPAFARLTSLERRARFQKSKKQLLIALKEATESRGFTEIIDDEFARVTSADARALFYLVGVATVARAGMLQSAVESIFSSKSRPIPFKDVVNGQLSGMVDVANSGRLVARHEIYARHVMDHAEFGEVVEALREILDYFSRFETPVIRHVSKLDGQIFKYVLNNKFIFDFFEAHRKGDKAPDFYEEFALRFQLDGHFWLQYGLLLRRLGKQDEAFDKLQKSIQAYPENHLVHHAFAQQKLIAVGSRGRHDEFARRLIGEAVGYLLERHFHGVQKHLGRLDEYPIVTLSHYHIDTLVRLKRLDDAAQQAKRYFKLVQEFERISFRFAAF